MDNDKIEKANTAEAQAHESHANANLHPTTHHSSPWLAVGVTLGVAAIDGAGVWWLIWASQVIDKASEALAFITGGCFTLALLDVAIVQACVYWSQRNKMQQSLQLTDRIIDTMRAQLDTMKDQAALATAGSRPYLDFNASLLFLPDDPIVVEVSFRNNGKSEAVVKATYEILIKGSIDARRTGSIKEFTVAPTKHETKAIGGISADELEAIKQYAARIWIRIEGFYSGLGEDFPINFCRTFSKHRGMATSVNHLPLAQACEDG